MVRPTKSLVLTVGFCAGLLGEGLIFIHRQLTLAEQVLSEDFRVVALPEDGKGGSELEARLGLLPGVVSVKKVGPDEALSRLAQQDPETAHALAKAPLLPESYELSLDAERLGSLTGWAAQARSSEPAVKFRYKAMQAATILQLRFYERFLELCGILAFAGWMLGGAALLWAQAVPRPLNPSSGTGFAGAALGAAAALALAYPLKGVSPLWAWPQWRLQLLVLAAGAAGGWWVNCDEK